MLWKRYDNQYVIRLDGEEPVIESLKTFARTMNVGGASIHGIGGLENIEFGIFDPTEGEYSKFHHQAFVELIVLSGNITWVDSEPFIHCHFMALKDKAEFIGGHLFEARASITVEIFLNPTSEKIERAYDPNANFKVMKLSST